MWNWGYPFNRSRLFSWRAFFLACITRHRRVSSWRGFAPMLTAWITWSGCASHAASCVPTVVTRADGDWPTGGSGAPDAVRAPHPVHHLRPNADAADGVVLRLLAVRHPEERHLGAERTTHPGHRLVPGGLGDAAPPALGAGAAGEGAANREGGDG